MPSASSEVDLPSSPELLALSARGRRVGEQPISDLMRRAIAQPGLISLAAGFVDPATLPIEITQAATDRLLSDPAAARAALQYGTTNGYPPLRASVLARLAAADHVSPSDLQASIDHVVVTAGSNQLLHLVTECLCDPGDIVLCTMPSYFVYLGLLKNLGVRAVGVEMDEDGIIPEALIRELERLKTRGELPRVKAIYVVSYFDNPSSVSLSLERRSALVEIAERYSKQGKIYILEDAAYRELRYSGRDLPSIRSFDSTGDTVIHAQTFSKSFSPGIRVGWGLLPPALVERVGGLKGNIDFGSPNFAQHLLQTVLEGGEYDRHVARLQAAYRLKLSAMLEAADRHLGDIHGVHWHRPAGGLYVWLTLPEGVDAGPQGRLFHLALEAGMLYVPGEYGFPDEPAPPRRNTIRLSYGVQTAEGIWRGMEALGKALKACLAG